jgi:hypothetical protein
MISEIWVIVENRQVTCGHGDSASTLILPTTGPYGTGNPHPAFPTKQAAKDYIAELKFPMGLSALPLEVKA